MASKKAGGSTTNGRDSNPKMLGIKLFGGQAVRTGGIILRQRGLKIKSGKGTFAGKDHTIHAMWDGVVGFTKGRGNRTIAIVDPIEA